jgi:hypothetical protein
MNNSDPDEQLGLGASPGQGGQKHPAVLLVAKDGFPAISPVHHGVDRSGKFTAPLARHRRPIAPSIRPRQPP